LSLRQNDFNKTIQELHREVVLLKDEEFSEQKLGQRPPIIPPRYVAKDTSVSSDERDSVLKSFTKLKPEEAKPEVPQSLISASKKDTSFSRTTKKESNFVNWEDFLGRSLISKIGIVILVLGIGYLTKFAIDNELINPLTRIIIGYVMASSLVFLALKWKEKYESLSAVVLTGSLGVLYFITYAAYDFYGFIPQTVTFGLMVLFTVFGMFASHIYNRKALAYISIAGAFAIPLLLSNNTGNYKVLFTYLFILDIGIIFFGLFKKWLGISLGTFLFSWLFFIIWFFNDYDEITDFYPSMLFATLFFGVFYWGFMRYYVKVEFTKQLKLVVTALVIAINAFVFYAMGYILLEDHPLFSEMKGLYTLFNALIHFGVFYFVKKQHTEDKTLFYVISGLIITFITIAIPVQLDGNWVTLIWFLEAVVLFGIGRSKQIKMFEIFAYPILAIGFFSLLDDWEHFRRIARNEPLFPLGNVQFLTNIFITSAIGTMTFISFKWKSNIKEIAGIINYVFVSLFVLSLFILFTIEIDTYWTYQTSNIEPERLYYSGTNWFRSIWKIIYTLLFMSVLVWVNRKMLNQIKVNIVILVLSGIAIFVFLTQGLYVISEVREGYFENITTLAQVYLTRYVGIGALGLLVFMTYKHIQKHEYIAKYFELVIHVVVLWVLSSELIHWLDLGSAVNNYRFGLTILWGVYALVFLIYRGIKEQQVILRVGGFVLFGFTLVKLFLYDLQSLKTIEKTIVFIAVGVLLLIISYLYNRNKIALFGEDENVGNKNLEENE